MGYMYKNNFDTVYEADYGEVVKINDPKSEYNGKDLFLAGSTINGHCYKDWNTFNNSPDQVCYICESVFDDGDLFVDDVTNNLPKLIEEGGVATANSIKDEVKKYLESSEFFYESDFAGVIESKNFDEQIINHIALTTFELVDWQTPQAVIYENDEIWLDNIKEYYDEKFKNISKQSLFEFGDYICENVDFNYDAPDESIIYIYENKEKYNEGEYLEQISLLNDNLEKNIKEYLQDVYDYNDKEMEV